MIAHKQLSLALCETLRFGVPKRILMGPDDYTRLLASIDKDCGLDTSADEILFEHVPIMIQNDRKGCVIEHDNRHAVILGGDESAVPNNFAVDRVTRKPVYVVW